MLLMDQVDEIGGTFMMVCGATVNTVATVELCPPDGANFPLTSLKAYDINYHTTWHTIVACIADTTLWKKLTRLGVGRLSDKMHMAPVKINCKKRWYLA